MSFRDLISSIKDKAAQSSAVPLINSKIARFGEVKSLDIDSKNKRLRVVVELKGEVAPVTVEVGNYEVIEAAGRTYFAGRNFTASREWLGIALNEFLAERRIEVPNAVKMVL